MSLHRLTGLDSIFLAAESATNPLHMMAIMVLDPGTVPGAYSFEGFRDFIARRLHLMPPLRRRLIEVPFGMDRPTWVEEASIDIAYHIRRAAVPSPGGPRELALLTAEMNERLLDRSRPLWEMVIFEGLAGGHVALVVKLSHAMMDGGAGVRLMASLFSSEPEIGVVAAEEPAASDRVPGSLELIARASPSIARRPARIARAVAHAAQLRLELLRSEDRSPAAEKLEVPRSLLNSRTTRRRSAAYVSLSLAEVKGVAQEFGATVNDVLLSAIAGALRAYLLDKGSLPQLPLVAGVPVSTREEGDDLANAYSSLFTSLETHLEDPVVRLHAISRSARVAKTRQGVIGGGIVQELADLPAPWVFATVAAFYSKLGLPDRVPPLCNLIVSNVAGPPNDLHFGGARIVNLFPLGPIFDGMALNITALSCGGTLDVGVVACRDCVPDLWSLAEAIPGSLAELREAAAFGVAPSEARV
jgi:WS/DGAT/MGAT family acyltransferase